MLSQPAGMGVECLGCFRYVYVELGMGWKVCSGQTASKSLLVAYTIGETLPCEDILYMVFV